MTIKPNRGGRPSVPPDQKLVVVSIRLTLAQRAKLRLVGQRRLREWLDRVKV